MISKSCFYCVSRFVQHVWGEGAHCYCYCIAVAIVVAIAVAVAIAIALHVASASHVPSDGLNPRSSCIQNTAGIHYICIYIYMHV